MSTFTIEATAPKVNRSVEFEKDLGANLDEAVELFGAEAVFAAYAAQAVIRTQAVTRNALLVVNEDGSPKYSDEEVIARGQAYKLGERLPSSSKKAAAVNKVAKALASGALTLEQLQEMVARVQAEEAAKAEAAE